MHPIDRRTDSDAWRELLQHADRGRRAAGGRDDMPAKRAALEVGTITLALSWSALMIASGLPVGVIAGTAGACVTIIQARESWRGISSWLRSPAAAYRKGIVAAGKHPLEQLPWPLIVQAQQLLCDGAVRRHAADSRSAGWAMEWHPQPIIPADRKAATAVRKLLGREDLQLLAETAAAIDPQREQREQRCCIWCSSSALEVSVGELRRASELGEEARQFLRAVVSQGGEPAEHNNWHASWTSTPRGNLDSATVSEAATMSSRQCRIAAALVRSGSSPSDAAAAAAALA